MNLYYGVFSQFVKLLYAIGMIVNLSLQLIPVLEIVETWQTTIYGNEYKEKLQEETRPSVRSNGKEIYAFMYDPYQKTYC